MNKYILTIATRLRIADVSWRLEYHQQRLELEYSRKSAILWLEEMLKEHQHLEHAREAYGQVFK